MCALQENIIMQDSHFYKGRVSHDIFLFILFWFAFCFTDSKGKKLGKKMIAKKKQINSVLVSWIYNV